MRDGRTRKVEAKKEKTDAVFADWAAQWSAVLVVVSGDAAGAEHPLDSPSTTVGRGGDSDLRLEDTSLSQEHAAIEFADGAFRIRDLNSTNGVVLNGSEVQVAELKHGDRIELGEQFLRFLLEKRERGPRPFRLPEE